MAGSIFSASSPRPKRTFSLDAADSYSRLLNTGLLQGGMPAGDGLLDKPRLNLRDGVDQADMRSDMDDAHLRRTQHHRDLSCARERSQHLGV